MTEKAMITESLLCVMQLEATKNVDINHFVWLIMDIDIFVKLSI